jgi:hypothetical protein
MSPGAPNENDTSAKPALLLFLRKNVAAPLTIRNTPIVVVPSPSQSPDSGMSFPCPKKKATSAKPLVRLLRR